MMLKEVFFQARAPFSPCLLSLLAGAGSPTELRRLRFAMVVMVFVVSPAKSPRASPNGYAGGWCFFFCSRLLLFDFSFSRSGPTPAPMIYLFGAFPASCAWLPTRDVIPTRNFNPAFLKPAKIKAWLPTATLTFIEFTAKSTSTGSGEVDLCGLGSIQYFEIDSTSELCRS